MHYVKQKMYHTYPQNHDSLLPGAFYLYTHLMMLYNALVLPYINYCCFIWGSNYDTHIKPILLLQKRAMRVIGGVFLPASANPIFKRYHVLKVHDIVKLQILLIMHKHFFNELPAAVG